MRKIVVEKKKKNEKFADSKLMDEVFKFYKTNHTNRSAQD